MSIDWGEVRFGLAFGSSDSGLIIPATFECLTKDIQFILQKEVSKRQIRTIVIGIPTNFQGQNTLITEKINNFIQELKRSFATLKIVTVNERSSTKDARKDLDKIKNKHSINHQAAVKILEYYFYKTSKM